MRALKILLLSPRISGVGGIAQHVMRLARGLKEAGHEVELVSIETLGVKLRKGLANPSYSVLAALKSKGERFDIVHGHNLPSAPAVKLAKARARIVTLHGVYSRQIKLLYGDMLGSIAELFERWVLKGVDAVTAVSLEAVKYYHSLGLKAIHIPNAIDLSELPSEAERVSEPQVTYLGRLSKEKGVDILVKAALMGLRGIVVAGDGPMRLLVERAAAEGPPEIPRPTTTSQGIEDTGRLGCSRPTIERRGRQHNATRGHSPKGVNSRDKSWRNHRDPQT